MSVPNTQEDNDLCHTKVGVVIPWDSPFIWTAPAFNMMNWIRPEGCELRFFMGAGWCPAARHNDGVAKALAWGSDYVMFNGADHLCPKDIVVRMLARIDEGWDMVQAAVPVRGVCRPEDTPFKSMSYKVVGPIPAKDAVLCLPDESLKILTSDDPPQQSHISGTGDILMKAEIFKGLKQPYFREFIKNDGRFGRLCVQDSDFVLRCTVQAGAKMIYDTDIKLVHMDAFGIDDTFSERFKDKAGQTDWSPAKDIRQFI